MACMLIFKHVFTNHYHAYVNKKYGYRFIICWGYLSHVYILVDKSVVDLLSFTKADIIIMDAKKAML